MSDFPFVTGQARLRLRDWQWACRTFTWAFGELRRLENLATARPSDSSLRNAAEDTADAIAEKLDEWEPTHRAN